MNKNGKGSIGLASLGLVAICITGCGQSGTKEALVSKTTGLENSNLNVVGNDDFNRVINPMKSRKTDKDRYVGIFYFTWLGQDGNMQKAVFDNSKFLSDGYGQHSNEYCLRSASSGQGQKNANQYHHWGKPLYGYYNSLDEWVIKKHMEQFINAGLDYIVFDTTNRYCYLNVVEKVCDVLLDYYNQGWDVPKISFYTNTKSQDVVQYLYDGTGTISDPKVTPEQFKNGFYQVEKYKPLWFTPNHDGKPMVIGITNQSATDQSDGLITSQTLKNFFYIKASQWPNFTQIADGFPWMDWTRPQITTATDGKREVVDVGVAQHNKMPFSYTWLKKSEYYDSTYGRGYHNGAADHSDTAINSGLNFEEEFTNAKSYDLKYTFITGWNEWVAGKWFQSDPESTSGFFVDSFNKEFSRDAEMMDGGYLDNYYLQIVRNSREIRHNALSTPTYQDYHSVDINSDNYADWNKYTGEQYYYDVVNECVKRDAQGFCYASTPTITDYSRYDTSKIYTFESQIWYKDETNRNDIKQIRVMNDENNIYVLVECKEDITSHKDNDTGWMNLVLNVNATSGNIYNTFKYVVNRNPNNGTTSIESYNGTSFTKVGDANYSVHGKIIAYKIPRAAIGATNSNFKLSFKALDNITDYSTAANSYTTGDVAPAGRLGYVYYGK